MLVGSLGFNALGYSRVTYFVALFPSPHPQFQSLLFSILVLTMNLRTKSARTSKHFDVFASPMATSIYPDKVIWMLLNWHICLLATILATA
jgi:hypothetical protein